ncbi:MAG TPA: hypothetical protein VK922_15600 [Gemmatimonadaceae bacterium]|nr:hypothetical protein [Gemmatimonadaceae bacterium]
MPLCLTSIASGAQSAADTLRALVALDGIAVAEADRLERAIWPGFRFDSAGLLYIVPRVGKVALRWPGAPPSGMRPLEGAAGAFWADTQAVRWGPGVAAATLAVSADATPADVLALAVHEAFHAYQVTERRTGRRFGRPDNAMLTARYPIFDIENEAAFAAESRLLRRAVEAPTDSAARRLAAEFLAVRLHRQARLDTALVEYEKTAELHEGIAQYALLTGLRTLAERHDALREGARAEHRREAETLDRTLDLTSLSVRRRFYATGSHLALVLDRLAGDSWKERLIRDDAWLQDVLARTIGGGAQSSGARPAIEPLIPEAVRAVEALRARRVAVRDSLLAGSGTTLVLDLSSGAEWCFFDPQNVLTTGGSQLLHMRVLRLCLDDRLTAQFDQPVIEDRWVRIATTLARSALEVTADGRPIAVPAPGVAHVAERVRVRGDGVDVAAARAVLIGGRDRLTIVPLVP